MKGVPSSASPAKPPPTVQELLRYAHGGLLRRGVARYLIPRNFEASLRRHNRFGTPIIRALVMGTIGRKETSEQSGYRLRKTLPPLDAATDFALRGSAINEATHLSFSAFNGIAVGLGVHFTGSHLMELFLLSYLTMTSSLDAMGIAVQRYNRVRLLTYVDKKLKRDAEFTPDYRNWFGLDSTALNCYRGTAEHGRVPTKKRAGLIRRGQHAQRRKKTSNG